MDNEDIQDNICGPSHDRVIGTESEIFCDSWDRCRGMAWGCWCTATHNVFSAWPLQCQTSTVRINVYLRPTSPTSSHCIQGILRWHYRPIVEIFNQHVRGRKEKAHIGSARKWMMVVVQDKERIQCRHFIYTCQDLAIFLGGAQHSQTSGLIKVL